MQVAKCTVIKKSLKNVSLETANGRFNNLKYNIRINRECSHVEIKHGVQTQTAMERRKKIKKTKRPKIEMPEN